VKALLLPKYTPMGGSSRLRLYAFVPFLEKAGFECVVAPLLPDWYLHARYERAGLRSRHLLALVRAYARRSSLLRRHADDYDLIFLQREAFPFLPLAAERRLFGRRPGVVVDYDDAVYSTYEDHANPFVRRVLGRKLPAIVSRAQHVTVGNRYLADWARRFTSSVRIIPTSVDLTKYRPRDSCRREGAGGPVIGWIGTPVSVKYLRLIERPLRRVRERCPFVLRVVGAPEFRLAGLEVVAVPWSEATEVGELLRCDIGVMPLPDDAWARGKSAFKLVQYLAAGLPAVASPVGANCDVLRDGENGFLAATEAEWVEKLKLLLEQPALRERLGGAGRRTVEARYSLEASARGLLEVCEDVVQSRARALHVGRA